MNRSVYSLMIVFATSSWAIIQVQAQESKSFEQRLSVLDDDYSQQVKASRRALSIAKDPVERGRLILEAKHCKEEFTGRVLALAQENSNSKDAPKALNIVIVTGDTSPEAIAAIEQLRRDWLLEPEVAFVCLQLRSSAIPQAEPLLRDILAKNPNRTARGIACFSLAKFLENIARLPSRIAEDERQAKKLEINYGREYLEEIKLRKSEELLSESEALFERVVQEFADVKMYPVYESKQKIGPSAEKWLAQRRQLTVGKAAPEIEGKTLDGQILKLSDYRGKVVVLSFWFSSCGPCLAMIPHERELVKRLEGKPFALLGINVDRTEVVALASVSKEQITWLNWFDGDTTKKGIADRYHIQSYPTVFVLDANGVIRFKDIRGRSLDKAVESLLLETAK